MTVTSSRTSQPDTRAPSNRATDRPALVVVLVLLAVTMAFAAALGPLVAGVLDYRTSPTTENQLLGSDAAALFVMAPLALLAAALVARARPAGAVLATGVGAYAVYTYAQVVIGQEYLRLPGNVEGFFPLLLAVFVLAQAALVLGLRGTPDPPVPSPALRRATGIVLLVIAAFLVLGLHLPTILTAYTAPETLTEYASAPTPFWLVKLMDLGIIVPAAVAAGIGLLRRQDWAIRVMYPLLTGYACLAVSVTSMAVVMLLNGDPDASAGLAAGFGALTLALGVLLTRWYRLLPQRGDLRRVDAEAGAGNTG